MNTTIMYIGDSSGCMHDCVSLSKTMEWSCMVYTMSCMDMKASFYSFVPDGQQLHLITCAV